MRESQREDFSFLWFPANTFPAPELVRRLAPLQAESPEPQVEEERGGLCQMERLKSPGH